MEKRNLSSTDLLGQLLSEIIVFRNKGQETRQLILMFVVLFAASVLWAKAAGHFGKVEREEHKKGGSLTVGGFGKISAFQLVLFTVESEAETRDNLLL